MRTHVGKHILKSELNHSSLTCGFCGMTGCESKLQVSSKRGDKTFYKVVSNCQFKQVEKKSPAVFSRRNLCTNWLLKCPHCDADVWTYNAELHFRERHCGTECPQYVSGEEKRAMLK